MILHIFVCLEILVLVFAKSPPSSECSKAAKTETYLETATELFEKLRENLQDGEDNCQCSQRPTDCAELKVCGRNISGVYKIWPRNRIMTGAIDVYCDMETEGGGWTVIQRRGNFRRPADYFFKNWHKYKTGFGDIRKDFWLGNDNIYALTNQKRYHLLVQLKCFANTTKSATYDQFWIDNEDHRYAIQVHDYSGNAGDALSELNGHPFSTMDKQHSQAFDQCQSDVHGGWWYEHCQLSNLNGFYTRPGDTPTPSPLFWPTLNDDVFLKDTEMKIRPSEYAMYDLDFEVDAV